MKRPLAFELLSPTRQQLILALKKYGQRDMDALSTELFLSPGAVRQNLAALAAQGVVRHTSERAGPGRPRHIYQLTSNGQRIFPDFYDEVALALVAAVEEEGPETAHKLLSRAAEMMFSGVAGGFEGGTTSTRLRELKERLEERGYLPEMGELEAGAHELVMGHCPIFAVARRHPETCDAELRCLQLAIGSATITRTGHRAAGNGSCRYIITES